MSLGTVGTVVGLASAGYGLYESFSGNDGGGGGGGGGYANPEDQLIYKQLPDYEESTGARQNWWETLQEWQDQPGYGAIAPNWNDIWENARQKVQHYFYGGPEGPGAIANVKAGLARRGASEDPASASIISRLNMQQGNQLQDMAVQQAIQEATLAEGGRKNWLSSLQSLAGLKPSFITGRNNQIVAPPAEGVSDTSNLGEAALNSITDLFGSKKKSGGTTDEFLNGEELARQNKLNQDSGIGSLKDVIPVIQQIAQIFGKGGTF